ncbi:hypothetical protein PG994_010108 [Apiospora phragmitis]|uniref:Uncharacterized protein n=1 Tax=Apiospora phragmitis TaxID=2905665 RepID=A0ABR1TRL8_9PEZI
MAPGDRQEHLRNVAEQAERDLNSQEAKTGRGKQSVNDEAGVDTRVENKFPGADVKYGADLSTNAGYNKRIPPEEGGELDARGRQTRGEHFEGVGGPEHKLERQQRDLGGYDNANEVGSSHPHPAGENLDGGRVGLGSGDALSEGREAVETNMASKSHPSHKGEFKGSDYYTPESVPDSISAEGNVAPGSVTQASRESEGY